MTTLIAPQNINTILNDFSYKIVQNEYDNLYAKYKLHTTSKQITNDYADIDELISCINNSNTSNTSKFTERKCYASSSTSSSNLVYATKELHDLILNPKFCDYLYCHGSRDMSKSFDSKVLLYGLRYFDTHHLDKKTTNPILLSELVEIQNTFRNQKKKEKIDNFIKKWTVKDRDIKINL